MGRSWYPEIDGRTPENYINLFSVLLHEIRHVLGISHLNNADSILCVFCDDKKLQLQTDSVLAQQSLCCADRAKAVRPEQYQHVFGRSSSSIHISQEMCFDS
jgi:hypothetical protein